MNKLEKLDNAVDEAEIRLEYAVEAKQAYLQKTVCDRNGHNNYERKTGFYECRDCGHTHITL